MYLFILAVCSTQWSTISSLSADTDTPLFLTKYIENNNTEDGRRVAEVMPFLEGVKSYSGLLTVDKVKQSHMFFWYFPAEQKPEAAPLLVWLNGYSTSSIYGVFLQNGPYIFQEGELKRRDISWQKFYHVLHIDNPVGVGYSFTESTKGYSKNLAGIANNLFEALSQFYLLFPDLKVKDLYLCGISMAGKYIPSLAYRIFKGNMKTSNNIKLKGLFIGNPYLDPSQISYGEYLYEHGFVDFKDKLSLDQKEKSIHDAVKKENYEAFYNKVKTYLISKNGSYLLNVTGLKTLYDYNNVIQDNRPFLEFVEKPEIKTELHVGNLSFNNGSVAMKYFAQPYAFSVKPWLEEMLGSVKMFFYNGQRDITWAYPMMTKVLSSLKWSGADGYRSADRTRLYNGTNLSGYVRTFSGLSDAFILNAGHNAISSQPQLVYNLLNNFTRDINS